MNSHTPREEAKEFHKIDVGAERIAHVYAEALFNAAGDDNEAVGEELSQLVGPAFDKTRELSDFLSSGNIGSTHKADFLEKNFRGKASDALTNFLLVLNHHNRLDLLHAMAQAYRQLLDEKHKRVRVHVKSAVALDDGQREKLKSEIRSAFQQDPVLIEDVDPDLLGGVLVRVGDWQYDGTVKARLNQLKNQLLERSSHEIQGRRDRFSSL